MMYGEDKADGDSRQGMKAMSYGDREMTELESRIRSEREMARDIDVHPDQMPEIAREMGLLTGAMSGLEQRLATLVVKLDIVRAERAAIELSEMRAKLKASEQNDWPVETRLGKQMRALYERIGEVEHCLAILTGEVKL